MTTANVVLDTPAHGADVDTWDQPLNANANIIDACFGTVTTKTLSSSNVTLTATEGQASILRFSGALTANVAINVSAIKKAWICENLTTGAFTVTITGGSGNLIGLPPGSCQVYWDGLNMGFFNLGRVGQYWDYAGTAVPAWLSACTKPPALHCNGLTFNASTYPLLNTLLGGNTLPDSLGRARIALDGGTNRVTTGGSGIDGNTLLAAGGEQNHTLDASQIPIHSHGVTDPGHTHPTIPAASATIGTVAAGGPPNYVSGTGNSGSNTTGITINNAGGGGAHNNMQPTYVGGITLIWAA